MINRNKLEHILEYAKQQRYIGQSCKVPPEDMVEIMERLLNAGNSPVIPEGYVMVPKEPTEEMNKAGWAAMNEHDAINPTYRAMLAAAPQSPGSEPATVPGKWIPVSERMPESNKFVLVSNGVWVGQGLYDDSEHLESDEHWQDEHREFINVLHHPVTHWMPLPAAPQKPKP